LFVTFESGEETRHFEAKGQGYGLLRVAESHYESCFVSLTETAEVRRNSAQRL
jgi:hypothetical protein